MTYSSIQDSISVFLKGLKKRGVDFVISQDALGFQITEVYVTEAKELILFPSKRLDVSTIHWVLQIRTPLKVRLTFFVPEPTKFKLQLMRAVSEFKQNVLEIPNIEHAISVQELTTASLNRFLDSLENWFQIKTNGRPLPFLKTSKSSITPRTTTEEPTSNKQKDLYVHLRNAIKTYWTERYFSRYLNTPSENVKEIAKRIGVQREVCGHEVLYFFDRSKALGTYFDHIIKGILKELNLQFQETTRHVFYVPDLHLGLHFFDGEKEQLKILAGEYANNHDLVIVVPETLRKNIGRIQDDFFEVLPLNQEKIKATLVKVVRQRIDFIPAYSSGIANQ